MEQKINIHRKIRSSKTQIEYLLNYMESHPVFASASTSRMGTFALQQFQSQWEELKRELDSMGPHRTVDQWKTAWRDQKRKKRVEEAQNATTDATGDNKEAPELAEDYVIVCDNMGSEISMGNDPVGDNDESEQESSSDNEDNYESRPESSSQNQVVSQKRASTPLKTPVRAKRSKSTQFSRTIDDIKYTRDDDAPTIKEELDVFGKSVVLQLKRLSELQAVMAQEKIQSILTQCRLADLRSKNSNTMAALTDSNVHYRQSSQYNSTDAPRDHFPAEDRPSSSSLGYRRDNSNSHNNGDLDQQTKREQDMI